MLTLKELEYFHIYDCLKKNEFSRQLTAKELGISTRTLRNKISSMRVLDFYIPKSSIGKSVPIEMLKEFYVQGMATNKERLAHADSMINRDYL